MIRKGKKGNQAIRLVLLLLTLLTNNVEELEAVLALVGGDDTEPVTELLLLEELLGQVLEVATGELLVSDDLDAAVTEVGDGDALAEVAGEAVNLDALLQEGGEGAGVEDTVVHGLGGVDDELFARFVLATFAVFGGHVAAHWSRECVLRTFLVIFWFFLGPPLRPPPPAVGFFCVGLSILLSSLLRMEYFSSCALPISGLFQGTIGAAQQSEIRTGPCTILSVFE